MNDAPGFPAAGSRHDFGARFIGYIIELKEDLSL